MRLQLQLHRFATPEGLALSKEAQHDICHVGVPEFATSASATHVRNLGVVCAVEAPQSAIATCGRSLFLMRPQLYSATFARTCRIFQVASRASALC